MNAVQKNQVNLLGLLPADLEVTLPDISAQEARRVLARVISDGGDDPLPQKRPIRKVIRTQLTEQTCWDRLEVVERATDDSDGFVKYLFRAADGALVEAVRIPLEREGCFSVCLSSQVGCAMGCDFCATGRLGLKRNLLPHEIVSQLLTIRDEAPGRITGAVFMGQGEPFHNYENVIQAAKVLSHPCGGRISADAISISTVGLVDRIRRYTVEKHPWRLIVSLTSAVAQRRQKLLPMAGQLDLDDLVDAIAEYAAQHKTRATVAWVMMGGVNTGEDEVKALGELFQKVPLRFNFIDVNDAREDGYRRATEAERNGFLDALATLEIPFVRRYSGGASRHAACGMLASTRIENESTS